MPLPVGTTRRYPGRPRPSTSNRTYHQQVNQTAPNGGADRLSAGPRLDPPTPSASPARLLSQPTVLTHLAAALAVWALGVLAQHWRARGGLEVELADVCIDNREALLCEHRAIRQTQPVHLAFLGSGPRPEIPNCGWQRLKSVHAFGRGDAALCLCWSARPYNALRPPHAPGLAQWSNGQRDSGARPRAGFCPPREPYGRLRAPGALPAWAWVRTLRRVSWRQLARRSRAPGGELARPRLGMTGRPKCLGRSAW